MRRWRIACSRRWKQEIARAGRRAAIGRDLSDRLGSGSWIGSTIRRSTFASTSIRRRLPLLRRQLETFKLYRAYYQELIDAPENALPEEEFVRRLQPNAAA